MDPAGSSTSGVSSGGLDIGSDMDHKVSKGGGGGGGDKVSDTNVRGLDIDQEVVFHNEFMLCGRDDNGSTVEVAVINHNLIVQSAFLAATRGFDKETTRIEVDLLPDVVRLLVIFGKLVLKHNVHIDQKQDELLLPSQTPIPNTAGLSNDTTTTTTTTTTHSGATVATNAGNTGGSVNPGIGTGRSRKKATSGEFSKGTKTKSRPRKYKSKSEANTKTGESVGTESNKVASFAHLYKERLPVQQLPKDISKLQQLTFMIDNDRLIGKFLDILSESPRIVYECQKAAERLLWEPVQTILVNKFGTLIHGLSLPFIEIILSTDMKSEYRLLSQFVHRCNLLLDVCERVDNGNYEAGSDGSGGDTDLNNSHLKHSSKHSSLHSARKHSLTQQSLTQSLDGGLARQIGEKQSNFTAHSQPVNINLPNLANSSTSLHDAIKNLCSWFSKS